MILKVLKDIMWKEAYPGKKDFIVTGHAMFFEELFKESLEVMKKAGLIVDEKVWDKEYNTITKIEYPYGTFQLVTDNSSYELKITIRD